MGEKQNDAADVAGGQGVGSGLEIARGISLLVALAGLAIAYRSPDDWIFHFALAFVVIPLGCIWYGKEIGSFSMSEENAGQNPLGLMITLLGWILLVGMLVLLLWLPD